MTERRPPTPHGRTKYLPIIATGVTTIAAILTAVKSLGLTDALVATALAPGMTLLGAVLAYYLRRARGRQGGDDGDTQR